MSLWDRKKNLIKPMLSFYSEAFDSKDFIYEIKFDGTRCIAYVDVKNQTVEFLNKRMNWFHDRYPELSDLWKDVGAKEKIILDGEVVVFVDGKPNFSKLAKREHTGKTEKANILSHVYPATFVVFDILHIDGKDLTDLPLIERKKILKQNVKQTNRIIHSMYIEEKGIDFFRTVQKKNLEGLIAKKKNSKYVQKRSDEWLKIKALKTLDVIIVGYTTGVGWRKDTFGSFLGAVYHEGKMIYVGRIGTGITEKQFKEYLPILKDLEIKESPIQPEPKISLPNERKPIWIKPELIAEVKFMLLTNDLHMRAPVFLRFREDKDPKDCVLDIIDYVKRPATSEE